MSWNSFKVQIKHLLAVTSVYCSSCFDLTIPTAKIQTSQSVNADSEFYPFGDTINKNLMPTFDIIRKKFHCPLNFFRSEKQSVLKHATFSKNYWKCLPCKLNYNYKEHFSRAMHEAVYVTFPINLGFWLMSCTCAIFC